jgi:glycosyltransferase involved in cell wall biosynthesis
LGKGEKYGTPSTQVIIAALNEEEGIGLTITEIREYLNRPRILVVDGKSSDDTVHAAKSMGVDVVFQAGTGKGNAISYAFRYIDSDVDYVVLTDADFTYPAEYVPEMIEILEENPHVGMVCGNRFTPELNKEVFPKLFHFGNRMLAFTHNMLNGVSLQDPLTGLRVVRAEILREWAIKSKGFDVEVELNHQVERRGFTIVEIPIKYRQRLGEKKLKVVHGLTILKRIMLETTY